MEISVLLPASLVSDASDLKQKTFKIGQVGRALAIFRVKHVWIYEDSEPKVRDSTKEIELISTLLRYMETPQYLRKLVFPRNPVLKYAGLLPPLRTPHHPFKNERNQIGSFREGVVIQSNLGNSIVEIGLKRKAIVDGKLKKGQRCTLEIQGIKEGFFRGKIVDSSKTGEYWGFLVHTASNLKEALDRVEAGFKLGTSRLGSPLYGVNEKIKNSKVSRLAVAFGGPYSGIPEICRRQGCSASELFDAVVNTIPNQGVATVRTEEALTATLALINATLRDWNG